MNLAFFFDASDKDGGILQHQLKLAEIIKNISHPKINLKFVVSNKSAERLLKKRKFDTVFYKQNFLDRFFFILYSSNFLISLTKKLGINNKFESFFKKKNVDIIFFPGVSNFSIFCSEINFVTYIHEIYYLLRPDLPEYKGKYTGFDLRDKITSFSAKKSMSVIVDTETKKKEISNYYNCHLDKINVIPLSSNLTEETLIENNSEKTSERVGRFIKDKKNYFFYPAQFWSHKNHVYLLHTLEILRTKYKKEFSFVFCGHKKNNFSFIQKKILELKLEKNVIIFDYVNRQEMIDLYKNCSALIMPTLIGNISLPVIEAFYFKAPVFYTKNLLDEKYRSFVNEFDINDPNSLAEILISKNQIFADEKVNQAFKFFNENLSVNKLQEQYKNFLDILIYKTNIYR